MMVMWRKLFGRVDVMTSLDIVLRKLSLKISIAVVLCMVWVSDMIHGL